MCFRASLRFRLMTPAQTPLAKEVTSISLMTHGWTSRRLGRLKEAPRGAWLRSLGLGRVGQSLAGASKASLARGWLESPVQWGGAVLSGDCLRGCGERMGQGCQRGCCGPEVSLGGSRPGVKRPCVLLSATDAWGVQVGCFHYLWV